MSGFDCCLFGVCIITACLDLECCFQCLLTRVYCLMSAWSLSPVYRCEPQSVTPMQTVTPFTECVNGYQFAVLQHTHSVTPTGGNKMQE